MIAHLALMRSFRTWVLVLFLTASAATSLPQLSYAGGCGPGTLDPDCTIRLQSILNSIIRVGQTEVDGELRYDEDQYAGAVRFKIEGLSRDTQVGDLEGVGFEAVYLPGGGGFRIRFMLAHSDVSFFCRDADSGKITAPVLFSFKNCQMDSMVGIGGTLAEFQHDWETDRTILRWAEMNLVINFLRNGNGDGFLQERLLGYVGASAETVWNGTGIGEEKADRDFLPRMNMGVIGMIRSEDNRWEIRGMASYRPAVTDWNDFGVETKLQILRHLLLGEKILGTTGLELGYAHWSVPGHSLGSFYSDRQKDNFFLRLVFRLAVSIFG